MTTKTESKDGFLCKVLDREGISVSNEAPKSIESKYILYLLDVAYIFGLAPSKISYQVGRFPHFTWVQPGRVRVFWCFPWQFCILLNIFVTLKQSLDFSTLNIPTAIASIHKISYFCYLLFTSSLFFTFWTQMQKFADILNEISAIKLECGRETKRTQNVKLVNGKVKVSLLSFP